MIASALLFIGLGFWAARKTSDWCAAADIATKRAVAGALWLVSVLWLPVVVARTFSFHVALWLSPLLALALAVTAQNGPRPPHANRSTSAASLSRKHLTILLVLFAFHVVGHWYHDLRPHRGGYWSAGASWEDQSFHSALATSVSLGDNLQRLTYPHLPDQPLAYPFIPDFQAGWLHAAGLPLPWCFITINSLASAVFLLASFALLRRWLNSDTVALIALVLWHVAGGFGLSAGAAAAWDGLSTHTWLKTDYANDWALGLHFHNFTTGVIWPMRVTWIGIAIALACLAWVNALLRAKSPTRGAHLALGLCLGALPLISAHALVAFGCACAPTLLPHLIRKNGRRWWWWTILPAVLITAPQALWLARQTAGAEPGFLRWHLGWMAPGLEQGSWAAWGTHLAWNTGIWVCVGLVGCMRAPTLRRTTAGLWLIFLIGQVAVFQPFVFDNIKLFALAGLAPAAGCAWWLARAWQGRLPAKLTSIVVATLCTASGLQSIISEWLNPAEIASAEGRAFADAVARTTPRDALILTGPQLHHPVLTLAGRRVVAANASGLTLHGIPQMDARIAAAAALYQGNTEAHQTLVRLGVGYIVLGPMERTAIPTINEAALRAIARPVLTIDEWQLLAVRPLPESTRR